MALGHWLKDYIGPHSGGSGGGGTEPLIIHVTEEEVKNPQTQETVGFKTDTLASDVYEAWQNGRPIYYAVSEEDEWLVSSAGELYANIILRDIFDASLKVIELKWRPFSDGYLVLEKSGGDVEN